jgi:uncharacterized membrane protein
MTARELWHRLGAWRARRRARRQAQRRQAREQDFVLWGGPVEAGRVLAFSDAIFAIAITLLTINLEVRPGLHGAAFTSALHQLLPALGAYALSFLILGQLWLAHHRIFGVIARVDYVVLRRNLLFLGLIAVMPFPVRLLSEYHERPLAVATSAASPSDGPVECVFESMAATYQAPTPRQAPRPRLWTTCSRMVVRAPCGQLGRA